MAHFCENCGSKMHGGHCPNCHEETFIFDQYIEQGMQLPPPDSEFMQKVREQAAQVDTHQIESEALARNKERWPEHYKS